MINYTCQSIQDAVELAIQQQEMIINNNKQRRFIGMFIKDTNLKFHITDIRRPNFTRIDEYKVFTYDIEKQSLAFEIINENLELKDIDVVYGNQVVDFNDGCYYEFSWTTKCTEDNLCAIVFKYDKLIQLSEKDIVEKIFARLKSPDGASDIDQMLNSIRENLAANGEEIFIYELLQNANDYPIKIKDESYEDGFRKEPVDVDIKLTDNYLLFRHSGAKFTTKNVAALCTANDKDKTDKKEAIGYKGIGFKTVFRDSEYVYVRTGRYKFRYDRSVVQMYGRVPWVIMPQWTEDQEIDSEVNDYFNNSEEYNVQIAIRPTDSIVLREKEANYKQILTDVFLDERNILFIPNINHVSIDTGEGERKTISRTGNGWIVSDLKAKNIDPAITKRVNEKINQDKKQGKRGTIPDKYFNFTKTKVSFACKAIDGVIDVDATSNASLYCYLPAKDAKWGFNFLMNSDMVPNEKRSDVEDVFLNTELAKIAGEQFVDWIISLLSVKDDEGKPVYDWSSVIKLIPQFNDSKYKVPSSYSSQNSFNAFKEGFTNAISTKNWVPNAKGELVSIAEIVLDETGITTDKIVTDSEFCTFGGKTGQLMHKSLRVDENMKRLLKSYGNRDLVFNFAKLRSWIDNKLFQEWLLKDKKNHCFLNHLLNKGKLAEFAKLPIFIDNQRQLKKGNQIYLNDNLICEARVYLDSFRRFMPYLSDSTRDYFTNNTTWHETLRRDNIFVRFDVRQFISNLLAENNLVDTESRLKSRKTSVLFFDYLAQHRIDLSGIDFSYLPFFDNNGDIVDGFNDKIIFFDDEESNRLLSYAWFSSNWITILSKDYFSDRNKKLHPKDSITLFKKLGVKNANDKIVIEDIIPNYFSEINESCETNFEVSKDFVDYTFRNQSFLSGMGTHYSGIVLYQINQAGDIVVRCADSNTFFNVDKCVTEYLWLDNDCYYTLRSGYLCDPEEDTKIHKKEFLIREYGILDYSIGTFHEKVVRCQNPHIKECVQNDECINLEFYKYLNTLLIQDSKSFNLEDKSTYKQFAVLDHNDQITNRTNISRSYIYSSDLLLTAEQPWLPENRIFMISSKYNGFKRLMRLLDYKEFSSEEFRGFFNDIILTPSEAKSMEKEDRPTKYGIDLSTKENVVAFHKYMNTMKSQLTDLDKWKLGKMPVYVQTWNGVIIREVSTGCFVQSNLLTYYSDEVKDILPTIDLLVTELCDSDMVDYWNALGVSTLTTKSVFVHLHSTIDSIVSVIDKDNLKNIAFWRWVYKCCCEFKCYSYLGSIKSIPILVYKRDNKEQLMQSTVSISNAIYMSDFYMPSEKGIEELAGKYSTKPRSFVSDKYFVEGDTTDVWLQLWRSIGVQDKIKDVIKNIIDGEIDTIEDKSLLGLIAEQFAEELDSETNWQQYAPKLAKIRLETVSGIFMPISDTFVVDIDNNDREYMTCITLPNEVSPIYTSSYSSKSLLLRLSRYVSIDDKKIIISTKSELVKQKIQRYLCIQTSNENDITDIHFSFINELVNILNHDCGIYLDGVKFSGIKLYDNTGILKSGDQLLLSKNYNPYCEFEAHGVKNLPFVSNKYASLDNPNAVRNFMLSKLSLCNKFLPKHLDCLNGNVEFATYFWKEYAIKDSVSIRRWIKDGLFANLCCIPTADGGIACAENLYSPTLSKFVKRRISNWEVKIQIDGLPRIYEDKEDKKGDLISSLDFKGYLDLSDCISYLLLSKSNDKQRKDVVSWLYTKYTDLQRTPHIQEYLEDERAIWKNGKNNDNHITKMYAIDPNKKKFAYVFDSHNLVFKKDNLHSNNFVEECRMLGLEVISDDMLESTPIGNIVDEFPAIRDKIVFRLLMLIGQKYQEHWQPVYERVIDLLDSCSFIKCDAIEFGYKELMSHDQDFYRNGGNFYYLYGWDNKLIYAWIVEQFMDFLNLSDIHNPGRYLDLSRDESLIIEELNEHCLQLMNDDIEYRKALFSVNPLIEQEFEFVQEEDDEILDDDIHGEELEDEERISDESIDESIIDSNDNEKEDWTNSQNNNPHDNLYSANISDSYRENVNSNLTESSQESHTKNVDNRPIGDSQSLDFEEKDKIDEAVRSKYSNVTSNFVTGNATDADMDYVLDRTNDKDRIADINQDARDRAKYSASCKKSAPHTLNIPDNLDDDFPEDEETIYPDVKTVYVEGHYRSAPGSKRANRSGKRKQTLTRKKNTNHISGPANNIISGIDSHSTAKETLKKAEDTVSMNKEGATLDEITEIREIVGYAISVNEMEEKKYLLRLRMYNKVTNDFHLRINVSKSEFVLNGGPKIFTRSGHYISKHSARGGILYISPRIWNALKDDKCSILFYNGKRSKDFILIDNQDELLKLINKDKILIQVEGERKSEIVNKIYSGSLSNVTGDLYAMVRVKSNPSFDNLFYNKTLEAADDDTDDLSSLDKFENLL